MNNVGCEGQQVRVTPVSRPIIAFLFISTFLEEFPG